MLDFNSVKALWCNFVLDTLGVIVNLASFYIKQMHLTPKDLSFVGYTYKNFDAIKALRNKSGEKVVHKYAYSLDLI